MTTAGPKPARVTILPAHVAVLEPVVEAVGEALGRACVEFGHGGPAGHTARPGVDLYFLDLLKWWRLPDPARPTLSVEVLTFPVGRVPEVLSRLAGLGYAADLDDRRADSPRWARSPAAYSALWSARRHLVLAVDEHRALRVVGTDRAAAEAVAALARAYPRASVHVGVPTHAELRRFLGLLRPRAGEPVGVCTGNRRRPRRVTVGLIGQLPRAGRGETDVLALPYAERSVGDAALRVALSGQYRRLLSFTRVRETGDWDVDRRLEVVAGAVWPPPGEPLTVVVLPARGARPERVDAKADPADAKRKLYWENPRRNRRVAEVAVRLNRGTEASIRTVIADPDLAARVVEAAAGGVAVLVETPAHARALEALLPGWAVWVGADLDRARPGPGRGLILTELAARETVPQARVLVRATGTRWPLPDVGWPWPGQGRPAVLFDFADGFHPAAGRAARARIRGYVDAGMAVRVEGPGATGDDGQTTGAAGRRPEGG